MRVGELGIPARVLLVDEPPASLPAIAIRFKICFKICSSQFALKRLLEETQEWVSQPKLFSQILEDTGAWPPSVPFQENLTAKPDWLTFASIHEMQNRGGNEHEWAGLSLEVAEEQGLE